FWACAVSVTDETAKKSERRLKLRRIKAYPLQCVERSGSVYRLYPVILSVLFGHRWEKPVSMPVSLSTKNGTNNIGRCAHGEGNRDGTNPGRGIGHTWLYCTGRSRDMGAVACSQSALRMQVASTI